MLLYPLVLYSSLIVLMSTFVILAIYYKHYRKGQYLEIHQIKIHQMLKFAYSVSGQLSDGMKYRTRFHVLKHA